MYKSIQVVLLLSTNLEENARYSKSNPFLFLKKEIYVITHNNKESPKHLKEFLLIEEELLLLYHFPRSVDLIIVFLLLEFEELEPWLHPY